MTELADHPNRLLVTATPEIGETYAEVAHEAIFRRWDKLRDWVDSQREFLTWKSSLDDYRSRWEEAPDDSKNDALLLGLALAQAQRWLVQRAENLSRADREFIDLSQKVEGGRREANRQVEIQRVRAEEEVARLRAENEAQELRERAAAEEVARLRAEKDAQEQRERAAQEEVARLRAEQEARAQRERAESLQKAAELKLKNQRRWMLSAAGAVLFAVLSIIAGSIVQLYANKRAFVERLLTAARLDQSPNFRQRIIILLHALDELKGVGRFLVDPKFARDSLRNVLVRAPKLGGTYKAVGFNSGGTKLAILDGSELTVHDLSEQTSASPLMVSWPPRENWPASSSSYRLSGFEPYVAGFIDHPERGEIPAVYHEGIISYWDEHGGHFLDVRQVLPPIFANANLRNIELMHTVRITANTRSGTSFETHFFELALTKDENGRLSLKLPTMSPHDSVVRSSGVRYNPTIATQCGLYGYLQGKSLVVHQLGRAEPPLKVDLSTSMVEDDTPGGSFVQSISFSSDCSAVTIRHALDHLSVIPIEVANGNVRSAEVKEIVVPEGAQDVLQPLPLRARPLIASLQMNDRYRFAWLTRNGIAVIDAPSRIDGDRKVKLVFGAPILTGLDNAAKLQFSRDGRFLILIHQSWGASHAKVRVWEINESLDRIPLGNALVAEACRIARQENGQAALEEGESAVFGENRRSPCQEIIETLPDPLLPHRHRRDTP